LRVRCLACNRDLNVEDQVCPGCGTIRDLPKRLQRGVPVEARPLVFPSRNQANPHVLDVSADRRVACLSCKAALHGRVCWAAGNLQKALDRHKNRILRDVLTSKDQVRQVLADHPEARDHDIDCIKWFWRDWYHLPDSATWIEVLELQRRIFGSFWDDRIVRLRAQIQNKEGLFPPCDEVLQRRRVHERVYETHFAPVREGAT